MLGFGTIFRYQENYYVHLVETDDTIYAAKILDKEITRQLVRNRDLKSRETHTASPPGRQRDL